MILKLEKNHQYKSSISINNIDINEIAVSNKVCFGNKKFLAMKMLERLDLYANF